MTIGDKPAWLGCSANMIRKTYWVTLTKRSRSTRATSCAGVAASSKPYPGPGRFPYARMFKERGRHYFQVRQADNQWARYPVDYTIGSKWQQAYATRLPNGQSTSSRFSTTRFIGAG